MSTKGVKLIKINNGIILKKNIIKGRTIRILKPAYKEEVILETEKCEYLQGDYRKVVILNRLYHINSTSKTIARCITNSGLVCERTSDELVKLIGQANYDTVFSSLLSVINQELKIRGILSLLTVPSNKQYKSVESQTDTPTEWSPKEKPIEVDKTKPRRRKRQALTPYVVQDEPDNSLKRVVVKPEDFKNIIGDTSENFDVQSVKVEDHERLPELGKVFDENSNDSIGNLSALSVTTTPELLKNPSILLDNVDRHTKRDTSQPEQLSSLLINSTVVSQEQLSSKSSDSGGNLQVLSSPTSPSGHHQTSPRSMISQVLPEQRMKFILKQASYDWKSCLVRDEDGYLPLHLAVLNNDLDLLKRHCIMLKIRNEPVDIPVSGGLTALKMSLYQDNAEMTAMLLNFGADPLLTDEEHRTAFHIAADSEGDHLQALIDHCRRNARKILEDEELWKQELENKSEVEIAEYLLNYICKLYDDQGYTPLMLASKTGKYTNVRILLEAASSNVNVQMPNSGNTALYLAVGATCMDSIDRCNKNKVSDNFRLTIELLLDNGADVNINNFSNSNVNDLIAEQTCTELSTLVANRTAAVRFLSRDSGEFKSVNNLMLFQEKDGKVNLKAIKKPGKPVIVANRLLKAGSSGVIQAKASSTKATPIQVENVKMNEPLVLKRSVQLTTEPPTKKTKKT